MTCASLVRLILATSMIACCGVALTGCADDAQQRTPWHQYLHDHGLE